MAESVRDSSFMGLLIASISEGALWSEVAAETGRRLRRDAVAFVTRSEQGSATLVGSSGFERATLERALVGLILPAGADLETPVGGPHPVRHEHLPLGELSPPDPLCAWWLPRCVQPAYLLTTCHPTEPVPESTAVVLAKLAEPIGRALMAHLRLGRAERRSSELQGLVDRISVGAVVADGEARIIAANRSADRLLARHDELGCWGGLLRTRRRGDTKRIHAAIRDCSKDGKHRVLRLGEPPDAVQILVAGTEGDTPRALVLLMEARTMPPIDAVYLAEVFDLTPAEIRLAKALLRGNNLTEAARHLDLSRNTAHSQLKSVFSKTQTNRQGELIALLLRSPTVMYREPSGEFNPGDL
jgi:DNA-binding CsgD family transcriptional regulator